MSAGGAGARDAPSGERGQILAAFIELVAEHGYEEVDFAELATRAGIDADLLSRHFTDRLACFNAAWDQLEDAYLQRLLAAIEAVQGWREQLRVGAWETARLVAANPGPARFLIVETLVAGRPGQARQQALAARLAALLERAHRSDPAPAPSATAGWVIGIFFDRLYRCVSCPVEGGFASQVPQLMFLAVSAYAGAEAGLAELQVSPS